LDRGVSRQWLGQELLNRFSDLLDLLTTPDPFNFLLYAAILGGGSNGVESPVPREGCAARKQGSQPGSHDGSESRSRYVSRHVGLLVLVAAA
jgi:hypothetical protein